jgi:hypothetical protein
MDHSRSSGSLLHYYSGLVEYAFETRLGVADPELVDYLSQLLTRFVRMDSIYRVRGLSGQRLGEVTTMLAEAEQRVGEARREVHRHIGDFTLFWSGVYPEALAKLQASLRQDALVSYAQHGKRAYYIASTIPTGEEEPANAVLERLSHEFELCAYGLGEVRREWERRDSDAGPQRPWILE